jgi:hypothetical protein
MRTLSYRQRFFIEFYLGESSGSAVDAARRAGYRRPEKLGPLLLKRGEVQRAIAVGVATTAMTSKAVLARIADAAAFDVLDFVEHRKDGEAKVDVNLIKRLGLGHLIKRLRTHHDGTQDIELEPRAPALVKLGEHFDLWKSQAQQQITLVELSKQLRAQYEELQRTGECGEALEDLPG